MTTGQTTISYNHCDYTPLLLPDSELEPLRASQGSSSSDVSTASSLSSLELEILNRQHSHIAGTRSLITKPQAQRRDVLPSSTIRPKAVKHPASEEVQSYLQSLPYFNRGELREEFTPRSLLEDYASQVEDDYLSSHRTAKKLLFRIRSIAGALTSICFHRHQWRQHNMSPVFPLRWRKEHNPKDGSLPQRYLGLLPKSPKPKVIVLMLQDRTFIDSYMYKRMRQLLEHFAEVRYCSNRAECSKAFPEASPPQGVLVVDAGITQSREMTSFCASYMRCGGRVIFAASFTNYMPSSADVRRFFMEFSCPWSFDEVKQSLLVEVNRALSWSPSETDKPPSPDVMSRCLPKQITFKRTQTLQGVRRDLALYQLKNMSIQQEAQSTKSSSKNDGSDQVRDSFDLERFEHVPDVEPGTEHMRWTVPTRIKTPVAWAAQKKGYIGVVCDMNMQEETEFLILVMLGLVAEA